jgi:hypothetical protein
MTVPDTRAIARVALFERYRADGATAWIEATGASMDPLIPAGSRLLVEFGRAPQRPGEVIVFRRDSAVIAHRFVARRGDATSGRSPTARSPVTTCSGWSVRSGPRTGARSGPRSADAAGRSWPGSRGGAAAPAASRGVRPSMLHDRSERPSFAACCPCPGCRPG